MTKILARQQQRRRRRWRRRTKLQYPSACFRADKFDSSFRRSRSSSTSSTTGAQQQLAESQCSQGGGCESIQCIAFVDPGQAGAGSFAASGVHQAAASSLSGPQTSNVGCGSGSSASGAIGGASGGAVPTGQVQSPAAGPNHKSLSQIGKYERAHTLRERLGAPLPCAT